MNRVKLVWETKGNVARGVVPAQYDKTFASLDEAMAWRLPDGCERAWILGRYLWERRLPRWIFEQESP